MNKRVLFVVTSHGTKGDTGEKTGYYLSEVSHPWSVLTEAGYDIDFVSPQGGEAPVDRFDLSDPINKRFWEDELYNYKVQNTMKPDEVHTELYDAIFYAGGHGAMWDFPQNKELANIAREIYEKGGLVSAVCHGPAGLLNIRLSDDLYLVDGKRMTGFTNEEEKEVGMECVVPFLLETALEEHGALYEKTDNFHPYVISHHRLITGQNPQSALKVGKALLEELNSLEEEQKKEEIQSISADIL